jgi:hypothetical protein
MRRLIEIQNELKVPKDQRNNFGGYNYRSCEGILEAVKPLLNKHKLALIINDEVISIDGGFDITEVSKDEKYNKETTRHIVASNRVYIKATATIFDEEGKQIAQASALAREEETKKGMDYSQLTGSTSSYARKYALNGLFAIDDTKDSDATNTHGKTLTKGEEVKKKKQESTDDIEILEGVAGCKTEDECTDYWNKWVGKLSGAEARKQLAELIRLRRETINE